MPGMVLFLKALKHLDAIQATLSNCRTARFGIFLGAQSLGTAKQVRSLEARGSR